MFSKKTKKKEKDNSLMPISTSSFTQTQNTITTTSGGFQTTTKIQQVSYQEIRTSLSSTNLNSSLTSLGSGFTRLTNDRTSLPKHQFSFNDNQKSIEYKPTYKDAQPFSKSNVGFGSQSNQTKPNSTSFFNSNNSNGFKSGYQSKPSSSGLLNPNNSNNIFKTEFQVNPTKSNPVVLPNPNKFKSSSNNNSNFAFNNELNEKLKINVKTTGIYHGDNSNLSKIPTYNTKSPKNRGKLLLINNIEFKDGNRKRRGADVDQVNITAVFKQIGFDILKYNNKTKADTQRIVKSFATDSGLKKYDICATIIMSHGTTIDGQTVIETVDGQELPIEWVVQQFHGENCGATNKPKIFIFQCCRGEQSNAVIHTDAKLFSAPRKVQDILISYSTLPGFVAYRDPTLGSWYIQGLCKVLMEHAHDTHIEDILKIVDGELDKVDAGPNHRQTSSYENRGFKLCYLNPIK